MRHEITCADYDPSKITHIKCCFRWGHYHQTRTLFHVFEGAAMQLFWIIWMNCESVDIWYDRCMLVVYILSLCAKRIHVVIMLQ